MTYTHPHMRAIVHAFTHIHMFKNWPNIQFIYQVVRQRINNKKKHPTTKQTLLGNAQDVDPELEHSGSTSKALVVIIRY